MWEDDDSGKRGADTIFQEKFCTVDKLLFVIVAALACAVQEEKHRVTALGFVALRI